MLTYDNTQIFRIWCLVPSSYNTCAESLPKPTSADKILELYACKISIHEISETNYELTAKVMERERELPV